MNDRSSDEYEGATHHAIKRDGTIVGYLVDEDLAAEINALAPKNDAEYVAEPIRE